MRKLFIAAAVVASAGVALPSVGVPAAAQESGTTEARHYSVTTTKVAVLLDDPEAAAILKELIPTVYANEMFQTMGRDQTLEFIQQYEPVELNDENLAKIQAAFDELAAKK